MIDAPRRKRGSLLDSYCLQLGALAERRHTELALRAAKQQAETAALLANEAMLQAQEAERAKTKFLANMTHELRTPLNAIIGFSEIIQAAQHQPKGDHPEYASYIYDAGIHLLGIVNGVLDLARIEAGKLDLDEQLVPLDDLIRSSLKTVAPAAEKKPIDIVFGPQAATLLVVDAIKLKQVFVNLLSNAVKFTPAGGRIDIRSSFAGSGELLVKIGDTGLGIPGEYLDRVLEPFGQVEDHLTRQSEGAGLGLPIARALVGLHGGDLVLESEVGTGTTVTVHLPRERLRPLNERLAG